MAYDSRIVVEQSPISTFINQTLPSTFMNMYQLQHQIQAAEEERNWRSAEAALDREFKVEQNEKALAIENYTYLRERRDKLEDELKGYKLPYEQTEVGATLLGQSLDEIEKSTQTTANQIGQLTTSLAQIQEAKDIAGKQADLHGDIIKAGTDEAWKDYLLEGGIDLDAEGNVVGTGEMELWLKEQSPQMIEKLKDSNYRRALLGGLRTAEEAKNLEAIDLQLETLTSQINASKQSLRESQFTHAIAQHEEMENQINEIYKNVSLSVKSNFRYNADGLSYDLPTLLTLASTDPDEFMDVKSDFLDDDANHAIINEAEEFISGVQNAAISDTDDAQFIARFVDKAYKDFLLLKEYEGQIAAEAALENKSAAELYASLPITDGNKAEIERLRAKVKGYKRLGIYNMGREMLDRSSAVISKHNEQQALRLNIDVAEAERISIEGLGLQDTENYYPSTQGHMTSKMQRDLDWALESLKATEPTDLGMGVLSLQLQANIDDAQLQLDALEKLGIASGPLYKELRRNLYNATWGLKRNESKMQLLEHSKLLQKDLEDAARLTGKTVEEIKKERDEAIDRDSYMYFMP